MFIINPIYDFVPMLNGVRFALKNKDFNIITDAYLTG
jgi:hypothetical protein